MRCAPLPSIDTNVNAKRKPSLNPRMHPAEFRIDAVEVYGQQGRGRIAMPLFSC